MKPHVRVKPPGPLARTVVERVERYCMRSTFVYPLAVKRGEGVFIEDVDGNIYLDFTSNIGSAPIGYGHPDILSTIKEHAEGGIYKMAGQDFYNESHGRLAEKLLSIVPASLRKVFLCNSGAEAVENAIKLAYRKTSREVGIGCYGAFHGRTLGALTFTYSKPVQKRNYPELKVKRIKFCTQDDDSSMDDIEKTIAEDGKAAFVLMEVVQGEGGYRIASRKFLHKIRDVTRRYGIPLIFDEVQSGMGRTGRWWAFEHYDVTPNIMTSAKALQVGAVAAEEAYNPQEKGAISSTWGGGHLIDLAVGLKTIEVIEKQRLMENAEKVGRYIRNRVTEFKGKWGVEDVRGLGLMIGVECSTPNLRDAVLNECLWDGLLLLGCGDKAIRVIPPLSLSIDEAEMGIGILEKGLKQVANDRGHNITRS